MKKIICAVLIMAMLLPAFAMAQEIGIAVENATVTFNDVDTFTLKPRLVIRSDGGNQYLALVSEEDTYLDVAYVLTDDGFGLLFPSLSKSGFTISLSKMFEELGSEMAMMLEDTEIEDTGVILEYYRKMIDNSVAQDMEAIEKAMENAAASVINYAFPETGDYAVSFEPDTEQTLQFVMRLYEEMYGFDLLELSEAMGISSEEDYLTLLEEGLDIPAVLKIELSRTNGVFAYGISMDVIEDESIRINAKMMYRFEGVAGFSADVDVGVAIEGNDIAKMHMDLGEDGKGGISMDIRMPEEITGSEDEDDGIPAGPFRSLSVTADLVPYTGADPVGPIEEYMLFDLFDIALGDPEEIPAEFVLAMSGLGLGLSNAVKKIQKEESIAALAAYFTPETEKTADVWTPEYRTRVTISDGSMFVPELPEELGMQAGKATIDFWEDGVCDVNVTLLSGTNTVVLDIGKEDNVQYVVRDGEVHRIEAPDWHVRDMEYAVICSNDEMSLSFAFDHDEKPSIEEILAIANAVRMPEYEELKRIAEEEKNAAAEERQEARKTAEKSGQGKKKKGN